MMSETDAPLTVFDWPERAVDSELLLQKSGRPPGTPVRKLELQAFFAAATRNADWHGPFEQERAARFRNLVATIEQVLCNPVVWRVGGVDADVYIVGTTAAGNLAGLFTRIVET